MYLRAGRWYLPALIAFDIAAFATMFGTMLLVFSRAGDQSFSALLAAELGACALGLIGLMVIIVWSRHELRVLQRWIGGDRDPSRAQVTWEAALLVPERIAGRALLVATVCGVAFVPFARAQLDLSSTELAASYLASVVAVLAPWALVCLTAKQLALRPVVREAAAALSPAVAQPRSRLSLRTHVLLGVVVASLMTSTLAAGFAAPNLTFGRFVLAIAIALAFTVTIALAFSAMLATSVLAPVDELSRATERIAAGDFQTRATVLSGDELGVLTHSFNDAAAGLGERERLREELQASRARVVAAADAGRRRVERDLHDGAQQRLVMLRLKLGLHARALADQPAAEQVAELQAELAAALEELRELAHGIYPAALESDGLRGALEDAAQRCSIATTVACDGAGRYPRELETAVYFCCLEALQNAAKHAGDDATARIALADDGGALRFEVSDDGPGFDVRTDGAGLQNMHDRIGALGGELTIQSVPGVGTTVSGRVPLAVR
jgi:signal transduction histidine kinase